jgi:hypothetical protein
MNLLTAIGRLELVAELTERLLRENNPIGNELARAITAPVDVPPGDGLAMAELALWAKRHALELGPERLASLVAGELIHLWRDQGKSLEEFSSALAVGWLSVEDAVQALGLDSSEVECSRSH